MIDRRNNSRLIWENFSRGYVRFLKKKNNDRYENQNEFNGNKIASILISNGIKDFSYLQGVERV